MSNTGNHIQIKKTTIQAQLDKHVHDYITRLTGRYLEETGKRMTVSQVIERALNIPSPQMQAA